MALLEDVAILAAAAWRPRRQLPAGGCVRRPAGRDRGATLRGRRGGHRRAAGPDPGRSGRTGRGRGPGAMGRRWTRIGRSNWPSRRHGVPRRPESSVLTRACVFAPSRCRVAPVSYPAHIQRPWRDPRRVRCIPCWGSIVLVLSAADGAVPWIGTQAREGVTSNEGSSNHARPRPRAAAWLVHGTRCSPAEG